MDNSEYTKQDMIETSVALTKESAKKIYELLKSILEKLAEKLLGKDQSNIELTNDEKEILNYLLKNPETAKEIFSKLIDEKIQSNVEKLQGHTTNIYIQMNGMRNQINFSTPNGIEQLNAINTLEKMILNKEKGIMGLLNDVKEVEQHEKDKTNEEKIADEKELVKETKEIEIEIEM
ncbi:MAG TPA: hypothetical protein VEY70_08760 [Metabacillus sp.]|nr:hypothetical protein [Metabacillus sp.]